MAKTKQEQAVKFWEIPGEMVKSWPGQQTVGWASDRLRGTGTTYRQHMIKNAVKPSGLALSLVTSQLKKSDDSLVVALGWQLDGLMTFRAARMAVAGTATPIGAILTVGVFLVDAVLSIQKYYLDKQTQQLANSIDATTDHVLNFYISSFIKFEDEFEQLAGKWTPSKLVPWRSLRNAEWIAKQNRSKLASKRRGRESEQVEVWLLHLLDHFYETTLDNILAVESAYAAIYSLCLNYRQQLEYAVEEPFDHGKAGFPEYKGYINKVRREEIFRKLRFKFGVLATKCKGEMKRNDHVFTEVETTTRNLRKQWKI